MWSVDVDYWWPWIFPTAFLDYWWPWVFPTAFLEGNHYMSFHAGLNHLRLTRSGEKHIIARSTNITQYYWMLLNITQYHSILLNIITQYCSIVPPYLSLPLSSRYRTGNRPSYIAGTYTSGTWKLVSESWNMKVEIWTLNYESWNMKIATSIWRCYTQGIQCYTQGIRGWSGGLPAGGFSKSDF